MQQQSQKRKLVLASTSPYKKMMLERLAVPFDIASPGIDEIQLDGEKAKHLVARLAMEKAVAVSRKFPAAVVIGSDQLAIFKGKTVGKPGTVNNATRQLEAFSGQSVQFLSALYVTCVASRFDYHRTIATDVCFRQLSTEEIQRYVALDKPLDCAGSFKSEAGGTSLLSSMVSNDPTAIVGLPLIALAEGLRQAGFQVP